MVQPARRLVARGGASRESASRGSATAWHLKAAASRPLPQRSHIKLLAADGEGERGRDHQQGRHDRYEQSHGRSKFVGDVVSPSTQDTPDEVR